MPNYSRAPIPTHPISPPNYPSSPPLSPPSSAHLPPPSKTLHGPPKTETRINGRSFSPAKPEGPHLLLLLRLRRRHIVGPPPPGSTAVLPSPNIPEREREGGVGQMAPRRQRSSALTRARSVIEGAVDEAEPDMWWR